MMPMDQILHERMRDVASRVFPREPVLFAYLFGSSVTAQRGPDSDIDVAVYLEPATRRNSFDLSLGLAAQISEERGIGEVDVVVLNDAPLPLLGRILKHRIVIFSRDEAERVGFESRKFREFLDFDFHARSMDKGFLEDMAEGRR